MRRTSELQRLAELAQELGFTLVRCKRHQVWRHANGAQVVFAATPGDRRNWLNTRAQLRRAAASSA